MIDVLDYKPEHLKKIKVKAIHEGELPPEIIHRAVSFVRQCDGEVVAIFGGFHIGPKVFHLWGFVSDEASKTPVAFHKSSLKMLAFFQRYCTLNRIQIDVRYSYQEGQRWAESLGFKREGLMRRFAADGEDCWLYADVAKEAG